MIDNLTFEVLSSLVQTEYVRKSFINNLRLGYLRTPFKSTSNVPS